MTTSKKQLTPQLIMAVVATGLLSFCGVIVETAMNISFPTLMKEFGVTTNVVQWMTSIYLLVVAVMVPLSAYSKRSFKTKHLFIVANLLFILGLVIDASAPNFTFLLLGRLIQGLGTGISLPLMFNIILEQVPQEKLGLMMGVANLITGISPALGPTFGGLVVTGMGWRWVFIFLLPFLVVSLLLGIAGIQQPTPPQRGRFDQLSLCFIALLFGGLVTGFANLSGQPLISMAVGGAWLLGLLGLAGLTWRSLTLDQPLLDLRLLTNRRFHRILLMFFFTQLCSLGFAFLLPNYIQLVNGKSALVAGMVVLPAGFAGAVAAPVGGRLLDKYGARRPIVAGNCLMLLAIVLFTLLARQLTDGLVATVYIFYMFGMGMTMGSLMTSALTFLKDNQQTQGNAILNTLQQFAGAMGTSLVSVIVAASQRQHGQLVGTKVGTQEAFLFLLVLIVIILLTGLATLPKRAVAKQ